MNIASQLSGQGDGLPKGGDDPFRTLTFNQVNEIDALIYDLKMALRLTQEFAEDMDAALRLCKLEDEVEQLNTAQWLLGIMFDRIRQLEDYAESARPV